MSEIVEFLLARIAEDEAYANAVGNSQMDGGWSYSYHVKVLAECAAKRRIVEVWSRASDPPAVAALDEVIELLALPYADHPDYREEWRP